MMQDPQQAEEKSPMDLTGPAADRGVYGITHRPAELVGTGVQKPARL